VVNEKDSGRNKRHWKNLPAKEPEEDVKEVKESATVNEAAPRGEASENDQAIQVRKRNQTGKSYTPS